MCKVFRQCVKFFDTKFIKRVTKWGITLPMITRQLYAVKKSNFKSMTFSASTQSGERVGVVIYAACSCRGQVFHYHIPHVEQTGADHG
jgi:hypothetical protein